MATPSTNAGTSTMLSRKASPFVPTALRGATNRSTIDGSHQDINATFLSSSDVKGSDQSKGDGLKSTFTSSSVTSAADFIPASLRRQWGTGSDSVVKVEHRDPQAARNSTSNGSKTENPPAKMSTSPSPVARQVQQAFVSGMGKGTPSEERANDLIAARSTLTAAAPSFTPGMKSTMTSKLGNTYAPPPSTLAQPSSALRASAAPFTSSPTGVATSAPPPITLSYGQPFMLSGGASYHQPPNYEDHYFDHNEHEEQEEALLVSEEGIYTNGMGMPMGSHLTDEELGCMDHDDEGHLMMYEQHDPGGGDNRGGPFDAYGNFIVDDRSFSMVQSGKQPMSAHAPPYIASFVAPHRQPHEPTPTDQRTQFHLPGGAHLNSPSKNAPKMGEGCTPTKRPRLTSANMCQYYLFGGCTYGASCRYSHDISLLAIPPPTPNDLSDVEEYMEGADDESQATASEITETPKSGIKHTLRKADSPLPPHGGRVSNTSNLGLKESPHHPLLTVALSPSSVNDGLANAHSSQHHTKQLTSGLGHKSSKRHVIEEDCCPPGEGLPTPSSIHRGNSFSSASHSHNPVFPSGLTTTGAIAPQTPEAAMAACLLLFDAFGNKRSGKAISEANTAASTRGILSLSEVVSTSGDGDLVQQNRATQTASNPNVRLNHPLVEDKKEVPLSKRRPKKEPHIVSTLDQIMGIKKAATQRGAEKQNACSKAGDQQSHEGGQQVVRTEGKALVILDGSARNLGPTDAARKLREEQHALRQAARRQARKERKLAQRNSHRADEVEEEPYTQREPSLATLVTQLIATSVNQPKSSAQDLHHQTITTADHQHPSKRSILEESPFRNCFCEGEEDGTTGKDSSVLPYHGSTVKPKKTRWVIKREAIDQPPPDNVLLPARVAQNAATCTEPAPPSGHQVEPEPVAVPSTEMRSPILSLLFGDGRSHVSQQSGHHPLLPFGSTMSPIIPDDSTVIRAPKSSLLDAQLAARSVLESHSDLDEPQPTANIFTGLGANKKNKNNKKSKNKKAAAADDFRCSAKDPLYDPMPSHSASNVLSPTVLVPPCNNTDNNNPLASTSGTDETTLLRDRVDALLALHEEASRPVPEPPAPLVLTADVLDGLDSELQRLSSEWLHQLQHTFLAAQELREFRMLQEEELLARRRVKMFLSSLEEVDIQQGDMSLAQKGDRSYNAPNTHNDLDSPTVIQKFTLTEGWLLGDEDEPKEKCPAACPQSEAKKPIDSRANQEFYDRDDSDGQWYRYFYAEYEDSEGNSEDSNSIDKANSETNLESPRISPTARTALRPVAAPFQPTASLTSPPSTTGHAKLSYTAQPYHPASNVTTEVSRWRPTGIFELSAGGATSVQSTATPPGATTSPSTILGTVPYYPQRQTSALQPFSNTLETDKKSLGVNAIPYYPSHHQETNRRKSTLATPSTPIGDNTANFPSEPLSVPPSPAPTGPTQQHQNQAHRPDTTIAPLYNFTAATAPKFHRMANGITKTLLTPMPAFGTYVSEEEIKSRYHSTYTSKSTSEAGGGLGGGISSRHSAGFTDQGSVNFSNRSPTTDGGASTFPIMNSPNGKNGVLRVAAQPFVPKGSV